MNKEHLVSAPDALDIVFANRNKAYGAYQLRREYPRNLARAAAWTLLLIGSAFVLPRLLQGRSNEDDYSRMVEYTIGPKKEIETAKKPEPLKPKELPKPVKAIKVTPPIVVDNSSPEAPQTAVDDALKTNAVVGKVDNPDGDSNAAPVLNHGDGELAAKKVETNVKKPEEPFELYSIQKAPLFPGGDAEMYAYIARHTVYPQPAIDANIEGVIPVQFIVDKDGNISDVVALRDIGAGLAKEAVRVIKTMPRWSPGEANGYKVPVRYVLPVRFKLN